MGDSSISIIIVVGSEVRDINIIVVLANINRRVFSFGDIEFGFYSLVKFVNLIANINRRVLPLLIFSLASIA